MTIEAPQIPSIGAGETVSCKVSGAGRLDSGELFTGTPTVTELGTADLTIDNVAVSTGSLTINGATVVTGQAITFRVSGQQGGRRYRLRVLCGTDASPAQTRGGIVQFDAVGDGT